MATVLKEQVGVEEPSLYSPSTVGVGVRDGAGGE